MARVRSAKALGKKGTSTETVPALRGALLAGGHYGLRREAALSLGEINTEESREVLFEGTKLDDARVRVACAEALGEFKHDETAAGELWHLLQSDIAYGVREAAVASLVKMKSKKAGAACREALKQESDRSIVRNAGLNGLVEVEDTDALPLVKGYASPGNDRNHRHPAMTAYAKLAKMLENDRDREKAARFLEDMLEDWYLRTRSTAISALGALGEKSAVAGLRRVENHDPLESLRTQARRTADRLESGEDPDSGIQAVETQVKDLENKIEAMEKELEELHRKVPEKATGGHADGTG
jgi:HEAT repeat protein